MINYHAVMIDETGCEFGVDVSAVSTSEALDALREDYPESRVAQIESPEDTCRRVSGMHDHIARGGDWDEEGRPIFHFPEDDVDENEPEDEGTCSLCDGPLESGYCADCDNWED